MTVGRKLDEKSSDDTAANRSDGEFSSDCSKGMAMIGANTEIINMEAVSKRIITKGTVYCSSLVLDFVFRS